MGQTWSTSLPPHPLTKRHTTPLGQVVAARIFFAGNITGAGIDAGVVTAGIFFAGSVTGARVGARIVAAIFYFFFCVCVCVCESAYWLEYNKKSCCCWN